MSSRGPLGDGPLRSEAKERACLTTLRIYYYPHFLPKAGRRCSSTAERWIGGFAPKDFVIPSQPTSGLRLLRDFWNGFRGCVDAGRGTVEVGVIGREGIVGSFHLLGSAPVSTESFMQLAGSGLQIPLIELQKAFRSSEEIRGLILEFVQEQALTVSQIAGCNRLHEADERLARWLLMASDRTQSDILNFTQEFPGHDARCSANHGHFGCWRPSGARPHRISTWSRQNLEPGEAGNGGMRLLPNYETTLRQPLQEEAIGTESFYFLQRDSSRGQTVVIASDEMQTAGGQLQSCIISAVQGGRHRGEAMRSCASESDSLVCPK